MVLGEWIKPGAIVIDVGINRVPGEGVDAQGEPKSRLVGDVAFKSALVARWRHHAGSGRRRADDNRHADGEYFAGGKIGKRTRLRLRKPLVQLPAL